MPFNPMQFVNLMKQGQNPQQMVMQMLEGNQTPFAANLLELAKKGDAQGIEDIARNMMKERGLDFDTEFGNFKQRLGL